MERVCIAHHDPECRTDIIAVEFQACIICSPLTRESYVKIDIFNHSLSEQFFDKFIKVGSGGGDALKRVRMSRRSRISTRVSDYWMNSASSDRC